MGVMHDFRCFAHGDFESKEDSPVCPFAGCNTVTKVFLQPAAFRSNRTGRIDATVESLAKSHGLTDISNRGGRAAVRERPGAAREREDMTRLIRERYGDGWGKVPKGGAPAALAQFGASSDNVLSEVKPALVPKPVMARKDPQDLKLTPDMVKRA